ncbi:hypothetical protein KYK29_10445 [Shinella daejeonensis]|uniref:hypothetical protein n=1 Tax=Shinella daejeonensis TaxID=659017 RepID=UPI0020C7F09A|nr:hypothetical protein [Shinella daejeonensis]MCP8895353.1 hypothetical protein [Shinella daejeonensis]
MVEVLVWPHELLQPENTIADVVPFTRTGGRVIGGAKPAYRTDLGHWRIDLENVAVSSPEQRRAWDAISTYLGGSSGRIAVPIWTLDSAPYANAECGWEEDILVPHSDGTPFSDGTLYMQSPISIVSQGVAAVGATVVSVRVINAGPDLAGTRFSYNHAAYKVGQVLDVAGDVWTVRITPSIAAIIPDGVDLEFHRPTCVCNLVSDTGMRRGMRHDGVEFLSVSFIEDVRYLNDLAAGIA